jgi:MFS family permease
VLKKRFLGGLALVGAGFVACAIAPVFAAAVAAFAIAGIGNGLLLVYERLLIQTMVEDTRMARVFGVRDGLSAWAFAAAFVAAGGLIEAFGVRAVLAIAGGGALLVWAVSRFALRGAWEPQSASSASS